MSKKKRRGRPGRGRPHNALPAVQSIPNGSQGAAPSCKNSAPKGQSPPADAQEKEQPNGDNVSPGGSYVNGKADAFPYLDSDEGIVWHKSADHHVRITNFKARIIGDVARDDGIEVTRHYEIAATLGGKHYRFEVGANQFRNLAWVGEKLGAGAIVEPGQGLEARARHAMQVLSRGGIIERNVYAHTGWREIDGRQYFLHAGGALGADGHRPDIEVDLPEQLSRYELTEPESEEALRHAVQGAMLAMALAPPRVMAPVLGAVYRAPIGPLTSPLAFTGRPAMARPSWRRSANSTSGPAWTRATCRSRGKVPQTQSKTCSAPVRMC